MTSTETASDRATVRIPARAWINLGLGLGAQSAGTVFINTPAFLILLLHTQRGLTLAEAGLLASAPTVGMVLTLFAWGALVDRIGERGVIAVGLALTSAAAFLAMTVDGYVAIGVFLLLGGMASASTNSASGSLVVRWFPSSRRGLAMGIRQMAVPLGVTIAAVSVPVAAEAGGVPLALLVPGVIAGVFAVACGVGIRNAPAVQVRAADAPAASGSLGVSDAPTAPGVPAVSTARPANPYRGSAFLWRIHVVSVLLVVPQFTVSTFGLVWLVTELGWTPLAAGVLVGAAQFVGAIGRILVGVWSDRLGSRVRPLRWVAMSAGAVMLLLALSDAAAWGAAAVVFVIATVVVVADNGLAFTSVAETAGPAWSGRALGVQNTGQYVAASIVGPAVGALIGLVGYPLAFVVVALFPVAAIPLVPRMREERDRL
ncbi:MFS transporter [Agreia sp. Leaf283]|uniref:MFS transporter n=1 Tax=Agreia sp. Leaf283 TaxID=1736321 RepID=UPI0006F7ADED|nr:MFS transporter [Agreia sp. Leaf283]KQP57399.1 MFS transporter [Agreia sp. Leaf283]